MMITKKSIKDSIFQNLFFSRVIQPFLKPAFLGIFLLFFLCFGVASIHSASLNESIVNGTASVYKELLTKLNDSNPSDDEVLLQKTLIQKLIDFDKKDLTKDIELKVPTSPEEFQDLFKKYIFWVEEKVQLTNKIQEIVENLRLLRSEISSLPDGDPKLLTLQLQYAFYKKELGLYRQRLNTLSKAIESAPEVFVKGLAKVKFDLNQITNELFSLQNKIDKLNTQIQAKHIEIERLQLLGRDKDVQKLSDSLKGLEERKKKLIMAKLSSLFLKFSVELKAKKKSVFETANQIINLVSSVESTKPLQNDVALLLDKMETKVLGKARTFHGQTTQEIKIFLSKFYKAINEPIFTVNDSPVSIMKLVIALLVFIAGFIAGNFYKSNIKKLTFSGRTITASTRTLLANLGYYSIIVVAFLTALKVLGIDLSSFALVAGALSVGIGFGLQNIVSNFVSGLILMFERSIKIGDYIEFDENLMGRVTDLRMRSITITTNANIDVIVPNQDFIQNRVINWTMRDHIRRFDIPFGVAYGTEPERVAEVVLQAVAKSNLPELYVAGSRKPNILMTGMGESSVDYVLRIWIKGLDITHPKQVMSKYLIIVYKALCDNGIEIPFPQRDIHLRSADADLRIRLTHQETESKSAN